MRPRLTYANVMVTILAFIVLGGGAYAAGKAALKRNSVGTKQIKNGAVTGPKIKNGAVGSAKLDPSVLEGYAKSSDLSGLARAPVGPDQEAPVISAGLGTPIYNVGNPGGVDCQGTNEDEFPDEKLDDIDFEGVEFDSGGVAHTEPGAAPNCYNGVSTPRAGKYLVTAFIDWEVSMGLGYREIAIKALLPSQSCCKVLSVDSRAGGPKIPTAENASAVASLPAGAFVFVTGQQDSGEPLKLAGGGFQIAYLGS